LTAYVTFDPPTYVTFDGGSKVTYAVKKAEQETAWEFLNLLVCEGSGSETI